MQWNFYQNMKFHHLVHCSNNRKPATVNLFLFSLKTPHPDIHQQTDGCQGSQQG